MTQPCKKCAGVVLESGAVAFLTELVGHEGRSRSWMINYIIRHYAQQLAAKQQEVVRMRERTIPY